MECDNAKTDCVGKYEMPACALVNDLMIFYSPRELYTKNVTILEMICASPCLISMICFSFEKKHRVQRAFERVHMNRHRMGAPGNAISFPLPRQNLLQELQGGAPSLPHTGEVLSSFVTVSPKTSDEGGTPESWQSSSTKFWCAGTSLFRSLRTQCCVAITRIGILIWLARVKKHMSLRIGTYLEVVAL